MINLYNDPLNYNDPGDNRNPLLKIAVIMLSFIIGILLCGLFGSCRSQFVDISEDMFIHDTTYINHWRVDSFIQRDSVSHVEFLKGDTVFIKDYVLKNIYKPQYVRDSVYIHKTDSVRVPVPVERKLTKWESFKICLGDVMLWVLLIALLLVLWRFRKTIIGWITKII